MIGRIEDIALSHGRLLRRMVLPITVAAALFTIFGKGLGLRIGGIAILTTVAIWACILYLAAEQRFQQEVERLAEPGLLNGSSAQLHKHVCETDQYWRYLHDFLAELAEVANTGVLDEPTTPPETPTDLGQRFLDAEKMMRELLDHLVPQNSRYVVYYLFGNRLQSSSEIQNGWSRRPPNLQNDSLRRGLLVKLAKLGKWVVLPNVKQPGTEDEEYIPLCFDSANFQSFASLPLTVEEPAVRNAPQRNGLAVGALVIESRDADTMSVELCKTAILTACDILALAFASARSSFTRERVDAKR